jgi:hypothetical protein
MPKRIIILERVNNNRFRYALWVDVPVDRQRYYVNPNATSAYRDASDEELNEIRRGAVCEKVEISANIDGATISEIRQLLISTWNKFQAEVRDRRDWERYGLFWDGTGWSDA